MNDMFGGATARMSTSKYPRFSSLRELDEWEYAQQNTVHVTRVTLENEHDPLKDQRERKDHVRRERERLEHIEQERLKASALIRDKMAYSEAIATEMCSRISAGSLLIDVCEEETMPTVRRCNQWLKQHSDFAALYKDSINDRLNIFEEQVLKIADNMRQDFKTVTKRGKEMRVVDPDVIMRAKIMIEVRFKHLRALRPERWGDSTTITTKSGDDFDTANMSVEELEKVIADIENKSRIVKAA